MTDLDWARGRDASHLAPGFDRPRSWKERPVDVRAEAAAQVAPQRRGEVIARRVAELREQGEAVESHRLRTPEVRRRRRKDPGYPSRWFLWRGERGKAYVRAWESYSWGLSERPKPWNAFTADEPRPRGWWPCRRGRHDG